MSQVPATASISSALSSSTSPSEKLAGSPASTGGAASVTSAASSAPPLKLRSCAVCRTRRVRCDKQSPCSNCRKAGIACVVPSSNRPPRWARRFERLPNNAASASPSNGKTQVGPHDGADPGISTFVDRIRNLENLVKDLRGQLESAHAEENARSVASTFGGDSATSAAQHRDAHHQDDASLMADAAGVRKQFGRLVLQDDSRNRYVSSGFWSEVNDELDMLRMETRALAGNDSDSSEDESSVAKTSSTREIERSPQDRHGFLFQHNLSPSAPDLKTLHPLPSQIPFLLDIYSENVNIFVQAVHMPTITKMVRSLRGSPMTKLSPTNQALMFSIYYAAVISMEDDDIINNFGISKSDLTMKYRIGMEQALAQADFLNAPDVVIVQALSIFLGLGRRHDSPRFVWMMVGLVIRMSQYLGLQRDGTNFGHLTPFEIETRRKIWWLVCGLDMRASEDQGTDLSIALDSFDTKMALNLNDADISPETKETPQEREGVTDMTFTRVSSEMCDVMRRMMLLGAQNGPGVLEEQQRLLNDLYQRCERGYFQYMKDSQNMIYWVAVTMAGMIKAKMTLIIFLPILFPSQSEYVLDQTRTTLLVSAIEVAEYNHELNDEQACRQWRWLYQTCTHWYAVVFIMIEIQRRPWSPLAERGWLALHSPWLIPDVGPGQKHLRIWVPLRKLMAKVGKHREMELARLRADPLAATRLDMEETAQPGPSSSGPFSVGDSKTIFRERWRQLVGLPSATEEFAHLPPVPATATHLDPSHAALDPMSLAMSGQPLTHSPNSADVDIKNPVTMQYSYGKPEPMQMTGASPLGPAFTPSGHQDGSEGGYGVVPWLWADFTPSNNLFADLNADFPDVNMDSDEDMNWHSWIESALGAEKSAGF